MSDATLCPCCGQEMKGAAPSPQSLRHVGLSASRTTIVDALIRAYPRRVTAGHLIEAVYSGSHEPANARLILTVQLNHIRGAIEPLGWTVSKPSGGQRNTGTYRLEQMP